MTIDNKESGYVYLIEATIGREVRHKIGASKDPQRRLNDLRVGMPGTLQIIDQYWSQHMLLLERRLQHRFKNRATAGEWFHLTQRELRSFTRAVNEENAAIAKERPATIIPESQPAPPAPISDLSKLQVGPDGFACVTDPTAPTGDALSALATLLIGVASREPEARLAGDPKPTNEGPKKRKVI